MQPQPAQGGGSARGAGAISARRARPALALVLALTLAGCAGGPASHTWDDPGLHAHLAAAVADGRLEGIVWLAPPGLPLVASSNVTRIDGEGWSIAPRPTPQGPTAFHLAIAAPAPLPSEQLQARTLPIVAAFTSWEDATARYAVSTMVWNASAGPSGSAGYGHAFSAGLHVRGADGTSLQPRPGAIETTTILLPYAAPDLTAGRVATVVVHHDWAEADIAPGTHLVASASGTARLEWPRGTDVAGAFADAGLPVPGWAHQQQSAHDEGGSGPGDWDDGEAWVEDPGDGDPPADDGDGASGATEGTDEGASGDGASDGGGSGDGGGDSSEESWTDE